MSYMTESSINDCFPYPNFTPVLPDVLHIVQPRVHMLLYTESVLKYNALLWFMLYVSVAKYLYLLVSAILELPI